MFVCPPCATYSVPARSSSASPLVACTFLERGRPRTSCSCSHAAPSHVSRETTPEFVPMPRFAPLITPRLGSLELA